MNEIQTALLKNAITPRLDQAIPEAILPWVFKPVARLAPELAILAAERLFRTPPHFAVPTREREALASGHRFNIRYDGNRLAAWSWGDGPTVFLLHGWGGRGGQFFRFVPALVAAGFSVVLFDAPAHGETAGKTATLKDFAESIAAAIRQCGPAHGLIAHSLGAAAATLALKDGTKAERTILLAPPESPAPYLRALVAKLGIGEALLPRLSEQVARRVGLSWEEISLIHSPPRNAPALIVADADDTEVPIATAERIAHAWPGAELMTTRGWGHHRLLRAPEVIGRTIAFLNGEAEKARALSGR